MSLALRTRSVVVALVFVCAVAVAAVAADSLLTVIPTHEPRAFGYQVGDVVSRTVAVHVPNGLVLDESSVPRPGVSGTALELRRVARSITTEPGGRRIELTLDYQVFVSPPQPRTFETPTFTLHFGGQPRAQEARIEGWPVTVSPLVPVDVSPRRGLGEWQPDTPPLLIDTTPGRTRLIAYAGAALVLLGYLAHVNLLLPTLSRANRPFMRAWRVLRRMPAGASELEWHASIQQLHEALNLTAGEILFEPGVDRFIDARPQFRHLRGDLATFFQLSRRTFFARVAQENSDRPWLIEFSRRCRDAERGMS